MEERALIINDVAIWLEDYTYLENLLQDFIEFKFGGFIENLKHNGDNLEIIDIALNARKMLNLDDSQPVYDILGLMAQAGIKVWPNNFDNTKFFGLSVNEHDGGPAIIVNTNDIITAERESSV
ncbi:MAG: hypothetical protein LBR53_10540 [Deltaproteobacteria bacterium]|jgi:hypothetical protein|nr:hypothetical protein [Deltaproteobacteria bacterium]